MFSLLWGADPHSIHGLLQQRQIMMKCWVSGDDILWPCKHISLEFPSPIFIVGLRPELASNQTVIQHVFLVCEFFFAIRLYNCNDSQSWHVRFASLAQWLENCTLSARDCQFWTKQCAFAQVAKESQHLLNLRNRNCLRQAKSFFANRSCERIFLRKDSTTVYKGLQFPLEGGLKWDFRTDSQAHQRRKLAADLASRGSAIQNCGFQGVCCRCYSFCCLNCDQLFADTRLDPEIKFANSFRGPLKKCTNHRAFKPAMQHRFLTFPRGGWISSSPGSSLSMQRHRIPPKPCLIIFCKRNTEEVWDLLFGLVASLCPEVVLIHRQPFLSLILRTSGPCRMRHVSWSC